MFVWHRSTSFTRSPMLWNNCTNLRCDLMWVSGTPTTPKTFTGGSTLLILLIVSIFVRWPERHGQSTHLKPADSVSILQSKQRSLRVLYECQPTGRRTGGRISLILVLDARQIAGSLSSSALSSRSSFLALSSCSRRPRFLFRCSSCYLYNCASRLLRAQGRTHVRRMISAAVG